MSDAPKSLFIRVGDICGGQVTATTYPFPEGLEYKLVQPEAGATWKQVPLGQTSVGAKKARPGHNVTLWHRDCLDESCDYEITITLPPLPQQEGP